MLQHVYNMFTTCLQHVDNMLSTCPPCTAAFGAKKRYPRRQNQNSRVLLCAKTSNRPFHWLVSSSQLLPYH